MMRFSQTRPVKVVMLGAGGTGGHIAPHLYRLLYALDRNERLSDGNQQKVCRDKSGFGSYTVVLLRCGMSDMEILDHLPSLHFAILCFEHGKLDSFMVDSSEITEEYYFCFFSAIHAAADFIGEDYNESYNVSKFYFSWDSMMEYYRLCREYSKRFGLSRKDNPYMCEAEDFVEQTMLFDHYGGGYGFHLQTRVNHRWASGLIVWLDEYFNSEFELAEALLEIGAWYQRGVERLKEALAAPQVKAWKEAA